MTFADLDDLLDDTLRLPISGKVYVIASPPGDVGLRVQRLMALSTKAALAARAARLIVEKEQTGQQVTADDRTAAAATLTDREREQLELHGQAEEDYYRDLLGPTFDELVADGVSIVRLKHVAVTVSVWVNGTREDAERFWQSGGRPQPEAPAPSRQDRRGSGSTTRRAGSTSGTRTRPSRAKGKAPGAAAGPTSSSTGS